MNMDTLKNRYVKGNISEVMLKVYVKKGVITAIQYKEITGSDYK